MDTKHAVFKLNWGYQGAEQSTNNWFVFYIIIYRNFASIVAMLAKNESCKDRLYLRQIYLDEHRDLFKWKHTPGLPGYIGSNFKPLLHKP